MTDLAGVFTPDSIAVIGVSQRETNLGLRFTRSLRRHGYAGDLWAVNRRGEGVDDVPGFASVGELPGPLSLAVIAVNADAVEEAVASCAAAGASAALVFTSGYAEVGGAGIERQRRLTALAQDAGMRVLGPNCVGFANVRDRVCPIASGFAFRASFQPGALSIITQSGGVAGLIAERALDHGIGLSHVVTTGNESDVTAAEVVEHLAREGHTRQIAMYLEAVREPQRLADALGVAADAGLGVAVFKAGSGESTAAAAAAHTGAVVGDDASFDAMCRQAGVLRVHDLDHLFLATPIMAKARGGGRVAVLSTSGGAAVSVADACEREGLALPPLAPDTAAGVAAVAPGFASTHNPIDISGTFVVAMEQFSQAVDILAAAPEFDAMVLVQTVHPPELAERIADVIIGAGDPERMIVVWIAGSQSAAARARLRSAGFAVSESAAACAVGLAGAALADGRVPPVLVAVSDEELAPEAPSATLERLGALGAGVVRSGRAATADQAVAIATDVGFPVVLKADAADITHKTERGGVLLGLGDAASVRDGFARLAGASLVGDGVIVQGTAQGSRELLLTARADPLFGLVLAIGFGGVLTEVVARGAIVLPPITPAGVRQGLEAAGLARMIEPFRGAAALDLDAVAHLGASLLRVAADLGAVDNVELNPVIVDREGRPWAVDALVDRRTADEDHAPSS
jgi:acyl-CoA synthetase (NDP forming)